MPQIETLRGIVVQIVDYREADQIVTYLTRDLGRFSGIAHSAKRSRKRFGGVDLFTEVRIHYVQRRASRLARIERCDILNPFLGILSDIAKISYASYFVELAREIVREREASPALYDLLAGYLARLDRQEAHIADLRSCLVVLLDLAGFRPELDGCISCGLDLAGRPVAFDVARGGVLCPSCRQAGAFRLYAAETITALEASLRFDPGESGTIDFSPRALAESDTILEKFIHYHLGKQLRSRKFLKLIQHNSNHV